jgi:uncharacterized protein (UPF0218 family)
MRISLASRAKLKQPMGKVISPKIAASTLKGKSKFVIAIGDRTGKELIDYGVMPKIWVYDGKEMRKKVEFKIPFPTHVVKNPRGNVSDSLRSALMDAVRLRKGRIFVRGEEDLATLVALDVAPSSAFVVYGQPKQGIVILRPDRKMKEFVKYILRR